MSGLSEFLQFMTPTQRLELRAVSLTHLLGLTGTAEGRSQILENDKILMALLENAQDTNEKCITVAKDALLTLINLTGDENGAVTVFQTAVGNSPAFPIVEEGIVHIIDENSLLADPWSMILSNITRVETLVPAVNAKLDGEGKLLLKLAKAFSKLDYNKKGCKLNYISSIFCNLSQLSEVRQQFCDSTHNLIDKLLPFASFDGSVVRRGGIIGILKNICFDPACHEVVLREDDKILTALLNPLCGPEEFTDEENDKFPIELQYLSEFKTREDDPDLRKMLLESLLQLCSIQRSREHLRNKGVYEILREYHKWEANFGKDKECLLACENVVDILIKKEEEIGLDNYKEVEVPEDVAQKFLKEDEEYLAQII